MLILLSLTDQCQVNNGGCDSNAICSHDAKTYAIICTCATGYTNTASGSPVVCKGKIELTSSMVDRCLEHEFFSFILTDCCQVNNGGCDPNADCSHNPSTNAPVCTCRTGYVNTGSITNVVCTLPRGRCVASVTPAHVNATSTTFQNGSCPPSRDGCRFGWHFITPDINSLFVAVNCNFKKAGRVTKIIQTPSTQHAYVFTPTDDTLISASAVIGGTTKSFALQHVCSPRP